MHETSKVGRRIEEVILIGLILLQIFDFIGVLPGDLDYIKKIVSWAALGYLFYRVSLTRILFGQRNRVIDAIIIGSYFLMFLKDFIAYVAASVEEVNYLSYFYNFILENAIALETGTFYAGGILLILIPIYFAFKFTIKKPSLMHVIHEEGEPPKEINKIIARFFTMFLVLVGFFIIVFNLMMEWLGIALDAPIVVFAIFFYLFIIVGRRKRFGTETLIYKIGAPGGGFFEKFVKAFHSKRGILLSVSGLLVLHLLTELGVFMIPYIFGLGGGIYLEKLAHVPIYSLLGADLTLVVGLVEKISLVWVYIFNIIAMLFLLITPVFIWYNYYKNRKFHISKIVLSLFSASAVCFGLAPLFGIRPVATSGLVGVDIWTSVILPTKIGIVYIALFSLAAGVVVYLASISDFIKYKLTAIAIVLVQLFFAFYIAYFLIDSYRYYIEAIGLLFRTSKYFLSFYFILFIFLIFIFYVTGYLIFLSETQKEYKRIE